MEKQKLPLGDKILIWASKNPVTAPIFFLLETAFAFWIILMGLAFIGLILFYLYKIGSKIFDWISPFVFPAIGWLVVVVIALSVVFVIWSWGASLWSLFFKKN